MKAAVLCALLSILCAAAAAAAPPCISEFLAENEAGLTDEDGDHEDWIEITNPGPDPVDLGGCFLTDDPNNLDKWGFPARILAAGERLVVFASNKNRKPAAPGRLHTNFKLRNDSGYLGLIGPDPGLAVYSEFAPSYPKQDRDISYGAGYSGAITTTDCTPLTLVAGTSYNRVQLTGIGTAETDQSLNSFDDSLAQPRHQQYLWHDYSSRLNLIPAGQTIVSATLEWQGAARIFAGVSGLGCVPAKVGIFQCPDAALGVTSVGTGTAASLVNYYSSHAPAAEVASIPGTTQIYSWDVTALVTQWRNNPAMPQRGQFLILNSAQPHWVAWDQNQNGPRLVVRTTANPMLVTGFMNSPTPGAFNGAAISAGPLVSEVTENPPPPPAGQPFRITARVAPFQGGAISSVSLIHRFMFNPEQTIAMVDNGTAGDLAAGDGIFSALIPASFLQTGKMVRWQVVAADAAGYSSRMPPFRFALDSPQYFGTVPADPGLATNLPVLHWFIQTPANAATDAGSRASFFYAGEFYDNAGMNLHGQSSRSFSKRSYDIDFNRDCRFRWDTNPLSTTPRVKDLNLLSNYADKTKMRQPLTYELFREAGCRAHFCFQVRVQQNGAFNGIYDLTEDGDDVYLERAGLNKDGALYKMYNNMTDSSLGVFQDHSVVGVEKKNRIGEPNSDLRQFLNGINQPDATGRKNFLLDNVDIPKMITLMAANSASVNIDIHAKNYYIYRDTGGTNEWTLLPWDLDLSFGRLWTDTNGYFDDGMYENPGGIGLLTGTGQNLIARLYAIPEFKEMARRRIRSLHDRFIQQAALVPRASRWFETRVQQMKDLLGNDAALDYTLYSPPPLWKNPGVATESPWRYYTVAQELTRWRPEVDDPGDTTSFIAKRRAYAYSHADMVAAQSAASPPPITFGAIQASPPGGTQDEEYIELLNNNGAGVAVDISGWRLTGAVEFDFQPGTVIAPDNRLHVSPNVNAFRARTASPRGGEGHFVQGPYVGHLSNLGETLQLLDENAVQRATVAIPPAPSNWQRWLVITEILYKPSGNSLAEFIELQNISPTATLSLVGVRFTTGISFDFTGSAVTSLAPGQRVLVVRNAAAFDAVFGAGLPVAGQFANSTALDNDGERIKLEDPNNETIADFTYRDASPWPPLGNSGYSIVLIRPQLDPVAHPLSNPRRWRASHSPNGNPAAHDETRFSGAVMQDADGDGLTGLLEYFFGTSEAAADNFKASVTLRDASAPGAPAIELEITVAPTADDATFQFQLSENLGAWTSVPADLLQEVREPDGRSRQTWRISGPAVAGGHKFARLLVQLR